MRAFAIILLFVWVVAVIGKPVAGDEVPRPSPVPLSADFAKVVYPILHRSCMECHGPKKQEGGLRLDQWQSVADSGVVDAGAPDDSELIRRVSLPRNHAEIMPAIGEPLSADQISILRQWIKNGADWPRDFQVPRHWAYVAPVRPGLPEPGDDRWSRSGMDQIVWKRLQQAGLDPSQPADPATLIRRVCFDLIGLPPAPAEVDAFVADPSEARYQRVVDELLQRPQFGERWARPWLDLARYADSHGFQRDDLRDVWAYRDWVIQALNDDMPFDQFTIEQIAGDLLPNATESQKIATGFHRCAPTNCEAGSLPEETRAEQLTDRVNTTAAVWLGTTLECAQCHDHKYDPFTATDYYRLLAFFNSTEVEADRTNPDQPSSIAFRGPFMPLSNAEREGQREALKAQLQQLENSVAARREELSGGLEEWSVSLAGRVAEAPVIHALNVIEFRSQGTTDSFQKLDDGSILLVGSDPPAKDRYTVVARADLKNISAFRLDALTHESLPGMGPGRGDPTRTNFVLNEFTVSLSRKPDEQDGTPSSLRFSSAQADFSQSQWDVSGAVDGRPETGWAIAPQFSRSHWATFVLAEPLDASPGLTLTVQLDQQFGNGRSLGRFRLSAVTGDPDAGTKDESVSDELAAILQRPPETWKAGDRKHLLKLRAEQDKQIQQLNRDIAALTRELEKQAADTTLVMVELEQPRVSYVFERGDYRNRGPEVQPGTPSVLHPALDGPPNRLTLAKWLVDPANPLVARVTVNRWWAEIFGQGIVPTAEDFGVKGESPTNPELLDWLAVEFMENDWSMKHMVRTMVLSSTYRQSSHVRPDAGGLDDQNHLLARGPRFRLDAEMIRDNALSVSGLLDLKQFGPPIRPWQPEGLWAKVGGTQYDYVVSDGSEKYRRGIYVVLKRSALYPSFVNFDASARLACTIKRIRTNTPLQALTLLNDPVYVEAARAMARRVLSELPSADFSSRLEYAFQLCTSRKPTVEEVEILTRLFREQSAALAERNEDTLTLAGDAASELKIPPHEVAAWYNLTTVLLNLHETITKP